MPSSAVSARQAAVPAKQSDPLTVAVAKRFGMSPDAFAMALRSTVLPRVKDPETKQWRDPTAGEVYGFLTVVKTYHLNPFTKEIYAFPKKGGGMEAVVGIDGWLRIINEHEQFDGMTQEWTFVADPDGGPPTVESCTTLVHRKDRGHPTSITEWYDECYRDTDPWNKMPKRMLRNRSIVQGGRVAFGLSMGYDEEMEGLRETEIEVVDSKPLGQAPASDLNGLADELGKAIEKPAEAPQESIPEAAPEPEGVPAGDMEPPEDWPTEAPAGALFGDKGSTEDPG